MPAVVRNRTSSPSSACRMYCASSWRCSGVGFSSGSRPTVKTSSRLPASRSSRSCTCRMPRTWSRWFLSSRRRTTYSPVAGNVRRFGRVEGVQGEVGRQPGAVVADDAVPVEERAREVAPGRGPSGRSAGLDARGLRARGRSGRDRRPQVRPRARHPGRCARCGRRLQAHDRRHRDDAGEPRRDSRCRHWSPRPPPSCRNSAAVDSRTTKVPPTYSPSAMESGVRPALSATSTRAPCPAR